MAKSKVKEAKAAAIPWLLMGAGAFILYLRGKQLSGEKARAQLASASRG